MSRLRVLLSISLLAGLASLPLFAKGATTRITIENPRFKQRIEIKDPAMTKDFVVFAGPGNTIGFGASAVPAPSAKQNGFIIDWSKGKVVAPPSGLQHYRISFYVEGFARPYVVQYAFDPSDNQGYVYLPGKGEGAYRTNVSMILRNVEGDWFRSWTRWDAVARPLIEKQLG